MKKILLPILFFCVINAYSQDIPEVKRIDSLVMVINKSDFKVQHDTIIQDYQILGLVAKTYLTMILDGKELKKYVTYVNSMRLENGTSKPLITSNTFYFDQNKLIKVEDFMIEGEKENRADWYYSEDKPLYFTFKSERSEERADLLLTISKTLLKQIQK